MSLGRTVGGGRVFNPTCPECARLRDHADYLRSERRAYRSEERV
jgi:hypothetical protein